MTNEQKRLMGYIAIIVAIMFLITAAYIFSISKPANNTEDGISVSDPIVTNQETDIVSVLNSNGINQFSLLLENANLEKEITASDSLVTVLVPIDEALNGVSITDPVALLQSHVIPEIYYSNTIPLDVPLQSSYGNNLTFTSSNGEIIVSNGKTEAKVINLDISFEKGNIFLIDGLLLP